MIMSLIKILETFIGFFSFLFQQQIRPHGRLYGRLVRHARFVFNAYAGHNTTCPLSSCSNKNGVHAVALTVFLRLLVKDPFV